MKLDKICVYTCITGNYDSLSEISLDVYEKNVDYYCFTNNKNIKSKTWKVIYLEDFSLSNHMLNRKIKILGHDIINDDYDILVWLDGNITLNKKISTFIKEQCNLEEYPFCAFKHPDRNCIYDEAIACVKLKKDNKEIIENQMEFYKKDKYPKNAGLCEMGIFVRKTNDKIVIETMNLWYEMINKYSKRDQLSFMWCVKKKNMKLQQIPLNISDNKYFSKTEHCDLERKYISDYRLYFGKSEYFEISNVVDGKYEIENSTYKIENIKIPIDTNIIEYDVCNFPGVIFKDLVIDYDGFSEFEPLNYYHLHIWDIFFDCKGKIMIFGDFKKDDIINISICLQILNMEQVIDIANRIKEDSILYMEKERKKYEFELLNFKDLLQSKVQENLEMQEKINKMEIDLACIKNSKGWKFVEKFRKIKKKLFK